MYVYVYIYIYIFSDKDTNQRILRQQRKGKGNYDPLYYFHSLTNIKT